jgi:hypothetical protein
MNVKNAKTLADVAILIKDGLSFEQILSNRLFAEIEDCIVLADGVWSAQKYVDGGDWGDNSNGAIIRVHTWRDAIDADGNRARVNEDSCECRV